MLCHTQEVENILDLLNELIEETNQLVKNGAREINLLGQNVNAYNFKGTKLSDLILEISKIKDLRKN